VGRDSTERFEGAVGDEVRDRGTAAATGTTAATSATRATATASATTRNSDDSEDRDSNDSDGDSGGDGELCRGDVASDVRGPHRRQQRRMAAPSSASTVRRRRDPDRVRDGPKRERGLAGATLWETLLGRRSVWGRWSFRERVGWVGRAGDTPGCRRRTVQGGECGERAHHRFVGIGVTRLISSNKS